MPGFGKQMTVGKGFEYACLLEIYNMYKHVQPMEIVKDQQLDIARKCFVDSGARRQSLKAAASAAIRIIDRLEPNLRYSDTGEPLILSLMPDSAGIAGDVRDILCTRKESLWQIGFSCKHNHHAVKHSRLSSTINFGNEWFAHSCTDTYFSEVVPIFDELREIRDSTMYTAKPALWSDIPDKMTRYYRPILQSFMDELSRLNDEFDDVPEQLVRYLIGRQDFYKIITDDNAHTTHIEAMNLAGTLNKPCGDHLPSVQVSTLQLPTEILNIGFLKADSGYVYDNTIHVSCNNDWHISMRLHNASSKVEPSLKFDVQLITYPDTLFTRAERWH